MSEDASKSKKQEMPESKHLNFHQGKDIVTKSLKKGLAIQKLISHILHNSITIMHKKTLIARLRANMYGSSDDLDIDGVGISSYSSSSFTESQLKILRQEQLTLMAENDKLIRLLTKRNPPTYTASDNMKVISHALQGNLWGCDSLVIKDRSYALEKIVLLLDKAILKILAKVFRQLILYAFLQDNVQDVKSNLKNNAIRIRMFYASATLIQAVRNIYRKNTSSFFNYLIRSSLSEKRAPALHKIEYAPNRSQDDSLIPFPTYYKNLHSVKKAQ